MKHELQIHTEAVYAQMSHFYEVCSHISALLSPVWPQTSDKQLSSLSYKLPLMDGARIAVCCDSLTLAAWGSTL